MFNEFDVDKNGTITIDGLENLLEKIGDLNRCINTNYVHLKKNSVVLRHIWWYILKLLYYQAVILDSTMMQWLYTYININLTTK